MTTTKVAMIEWAANALGVPPAQVRQVVLAGDASARQYSRLLTPSGSFIIADASAEPGVTTKVVAVAETLRRAGVRIPTLIASDQAAGLSLQEDAGDQVLLSELTAESVDYWYTQAMPPLRALAGADTEASNLPPYDRDALQLELDVCPQWFFRGLLDLSLDTEFVFAQTQLQEFLIAQALAQPQVVVHRDFHSRNLMIRDAEIVVIDFQDALIGPLCYDWVSLFKDCYCRWPRAQILQWLRTLHQSLPERLQASSDTILVQWFDWIGLQRHLKVLGVFARLHLRDGKSQYLGDLPRVLAYIDEVFTLYADHSEIAPFIRCWRRVVEPALMQQPWYAR